MITIPSPAQLHCVSDLLDEADIKEFISKIRADDKITIAYQIPSGGQKRHDGVSSDLFPAAIQEYLGYANVNVIITRKMTL